MNRLLTLRPVRIATILVAIAAWIGATNHCALRCIEKTAQQCCCPVHQPAPVDHGSPAQLTCCTSLRAVLQSPAKAPEGYEVCVTLLGEWSPNGAADCPVDRRHQPAIADTGPPRAARFAELVLQGCLRGHAPPFVV